jgi:multiple sugar transport system ATP-binding protein
MNTLPCQLLQDGSDWQVRSGGFAVTVSQDWINRNRLTDQGGKPVVLGIRPNRIDLADAGQAGAANVETGRVYAVETLGSETIFDVEIEHEIIRVWTRSHAPGLSRYRVGDPIHVRVAPKAIFLFDARSGRAIACPDPQTAPGH